MYDFDYKLNWIIEWVNKGLSFYGQLMDASNKFFSENLPQILPFELVEVMEDVIKQRQVQKISALHLYNS